MVQCYTQSQTTVRPYTNMAEHTFIFHHDCVHDFFLSEFLLFLLDQYIQHILMSQRATLPPFVFFSN